MRFSSLAVFQKLTNRKLHGQAARTTLVIGPSSISSQHYRVETWMAKMFGEGARLTSKLSQGSVARKRTREGHSEVSRGVIHQSLPAEERQHSRMIAYGAVCSS